MKILAFSDLHRDLNQAEALTRMAEDADVVVGAGDFASAHQGLEETIEALSGIETPAVLVPGNNETHEALSEAVASLWPAAYVLHGNEVEIDGRIFFGLGAGIPTTPWDWSFDLDETEAEAALADLPEHAILVVHSPPRNHCDTAGDGMHLGSTAVLAAIERTDPRLVVCGHIHEAWGQTSKVGGTEIINLGPSGRLIEV
jgi:Icc-related predicted phosphoesterase